VKFETSIVIRRLEGLIALGAGRQLDLDPMLAPEPLVEHRE
jgi:hypothetical protein